MDSTFAATATATVASWTSFLFPKTARTAGAGNNAPAPAIPLAGMTPIDQVGSLSPPPPLVMPYPALSLSPSPSGQVAGGVPAAVPYSDGSQSLQQSPTTTSMFPELLVVPSPINFPPPTRRHNPGPVAHADQSARRVLNVDAFEGLRIELTQPLNNNFVTMHTITMAPATGQQGVNPNTYQFGANLAIGDILLVSHVDHEGRVGAKWHQSYGGQGGTWSHKINADLSSVEHESGFIAEFERKGSDSTSGLKIGNGTLLGISYFQAVSPCFAFGGEGIWHGGRRGTVVYGRGRYTDNNITATASITTMGTISGTFLRKVTERVTLATEIEAAPLSMDAYVSAGYNIQFRTAHVQANLSSSGVVTVGVQQMIIPGVNLSFVGQLNHWDDSHRFGIGFQTG